MINFKQEQLIEELFAAIKTQFPDVEFLSVTESPENPHDLWLNVTAPAEEDREMALSAYASEKTIDILTEYGYSFCVMLCRSDSYLGTYTLYALQNRDKYENETARKVNHAMTEDIFNKAQENLKAAELCFEHGLYNACANRTYYAGLQAAVAVLAQKGFKKDKIEHEWVQSEFSERFVNRQKIFPAKLKAYLPDMQFMRNTADYSEKEVSQPKAYKRLLWAKEMIELIGKELSR